MNCETRPEKLKFEARGLREGVGYMERWVQRAASLPPHQLIGLIMIVGASVVLLVRMLKVASPTGGPGRSYGIMWFWCISGLENQVISTFHSQFCQSCARPLTSRVIVVKFHFTIVGGSVNPSSTP